MTKFAPKLTKMFKHFGPPRWPIFRPNNQWETCTFLDRFLKHFWQPCWAHLAGQNLMQTHRNWDQILGAILETFWSLPDHPKWIQKPSQKQRNFQQAVRSHFGWILGPFPSLSESPFGYFFQFQGRSFSCRSSNSRVRASPPTSENAPKACQNGQKMS